MTPDDLLDADGDPFPERRHSAGRREEDALDADLLLGYERWAGHVWRHRGKILVVFSFAGATCGYAGGYLGRAHDLDQLSDRVAANERRITNQSDAIQELRTSARVQNVILCSMSRRLDPAGTPPECGTSPGGR